MTYPWDMPATEEEIAEGNALFEAGWRGVSNRHQMISLFDQEACDAWFRDHKPGMILRADYRPEHYLRCGDGPNRYVAFHVYRQIKRRENA